LLPAGRRSARTVGHAWTEGDSPFVDNLVEGVVDDLAQTVAFHLRRKHFHALALHAPNLGIIAAADGVDLLFVFAHDAYLL
jgi:hypothetical protein